jgi:RimJ/RimL family protein N-acetyltransferase
VFGVPKVKCRYSGLHVARSARLDIVTSRVSDLARYTEAASEPEAQQWLGWRPEELAQDELGLRADPLDGGQQVVRLSLDFLFFAGIERTTGDLVAGIQVYRANDGSRAVGGTVSRPYRGKGYGREALAVVCELAHRHFGIARLTAGCEATNLASRAWLTSCGFRQTAGPATHVLPNGRQIDSLWWERTDPRAKSRCMGLTQVPGTRCAPSPGKVHDTEGAR